MLAEIRAAFADMQKFSLRNCFIGAPCIIRGDALTRGHPAKRPAGQQQLMARELKTISAALSPSSSAGRERGTDDCVTLGHLATMTNFK